jgi:hypothetical protein
MPVSLSNLKKKDQYKALWNELESWLKAFENQSERHKTLYDYISRLKKKSILSSNELPLNDDQSNSKRNEQILNTNKIDLNENK